MPHVNCKNCNTIFIKSQTEINRKPNHFCSQQCRINFNKSETKVICKNCSKQFIKYNSQISKSKNNFCSRSCSATYNNNHKKYGYKRSKLEVYLEEQLREQFPELKIICNNKEIIGSELDFYFPTLNLAIEINGIFHYEPIYGKDKLTNIQNNDKAKLRACNQNNIDLISIPTLENYMTKVIKDQYFQQIKNIIYARI